MRTDNPMRRAFTLIEVLAASTIAAFLMAAVLSVVTLVVRDRAKLRIPKSPQIQMQPVLDLLRRDLLNARQFSQALNGRRLTLTGFGGIDPNARVPDGRPVFVEYRVENRGEHVWLLRIQRYLDDRARSGTTTTVVSGNVDRIQTQPIATQGEARDDRPPSSELPAVSPSELISGQDAKEATRDGDITQAMTIHLDLHDGAMVDSTFIAR